MSEIIDLATDVARDAVTTALCNTGGASRLANDLLNKVNPRYDATPSGRIARAGERALRSFCPVPPTETIDDNLPGPRQFEGGQCVGVLYRVIMEGEIVDRVDCDREQAMEVRNNVPGPIISFALANQDISFCDDQGDVFIDVEYVRGDPPGTSIAWRPAGNRRFETLPKITIERMDGLPDDCGSPPPEPPPNPQPPSSPSPPPTTIVIDLPDIGPINFTFSPTIGVTFVDADFNLTVPVNVEIEAPDVNIDFSTTVNINISDPTQPPTLPPEAPPENPDGRPEPPDCPPPVECDEEPEEEEEEEDPPLEEDDVELEILGAIVRVSSVSFPNRATEIGQGRNPNIYAPNLGFVNFAYQAPNGDKVWGPDIAVKNREFVIGAPYNGLRCTDVAGTPAQGVQWSISYVAGRRGCS